MLLQDALAALLCASAIRVDADHLTEGLPISDGILSEELLARVLKRVCFEVVWHAPETVRDLAFPCCVPLKTGGYVVALGLDEDTLRVADAIESTAYRNVQVAAFEADFDQRAFEVLPSADLLLEKHASGTEKKHWFWGRLLLQKRSLYEIVAASVFANLLAVVTSLFVLQVYDRVIPSQSEATLWVLASGVGLAILFEAILRMARASLIDQISKEAEIDITSDIFMRMMGMRIDQRPSPPGAIVHMVREFSAVKEFFTNAAVGVAADLPFVAIFLLLIYGIAGHVVWIIVLGAALIVLPNIAFQGRMMQLSREAMGGMASASRLLTEAAYGMEAIKSSRAESLFQRQWEEIIALNALKTTQQRTLRAGLTYWATSLQQATYVFAVIACVYLVFASELSIGAIIAVGILTTRTLSPVSQLSQTLSGWQNMKAALEAVETVVLSEQDRNPKRSYVSRSRLRGQLSLQRVCFAYPGAKTIAVDIENLELKKGTRLALLGANGSGKSSLLRLSAGLHHPTSGGIFVDGLDMRQLDPGDLRRNIGYLPQTIQMFRGSLRENLAVGEQKRSDQEMFAALAFGGLSDFVERHPEGLDLQIADGGDGLSVGQRQSIGLARIYLQDPAIILLDEPTSALDQALEKTIVDRLGQWIGSRTCLVATHRPQIVSQMTHVAILQQGRVILEGERATVLNKLKNLPSVVKNMGEL